jgi:hypothetical protein
MSLRSIGIAASLVVFAFACGSSERRSGFASDQDPTDPSSGDDTGGNIAGDGADDDDDGPGVPTSQCGINHGSGNDPDKDYDGDGFPLKNDCNECNKSINSGARDIPGNGIDEDCSGTADDEPASCDTSLDVAPGDAYEAAAAMGLCKKADKDGVGWGVIEAKFVKADGKPLTGDKLDIGVLPAFGVNKPKEGKRMFVISTGLARSPKDDGYNALSGGNSGSTGLPAGYPKEAPSCQDVPNYEVSTQAADSAGLQVKIRVPSNAKSFSYEHFFLTQEFPDWVCTEYNDFFVTLMTPTPAGLEDANIAFDSQNNPIGVNSGLFRVCNPGDYDIGSSAGLGGGDTVSRHVDCPDGPALLKGTGPRYEGQGGIISTKPGGGTGWLTTTAPVSGGQEITLLFTVWDSGDNKLDSTVFLDNFQWSLESSPTVDTSPTGVK